MLTCLFHLLLAGQGEPAAAASAAAVYQENILLKQQMEEIQREMALQRELLMKALGNKLQ